MSAKEGRISLVAIFTGLTIISVPFSIVAVGGIGVLMYVGVPLIILSLFRAKNGFRVLRDVKPVFWLFFFIIYDALSYIWSPASPVVFFRTTIVTIFIILNKYTEKEQRLLYVFACIPTLIIFYNIITGQFTSIGDSERITVIIGGIETDPNYISFCFFPAVAIISNALLNNSKKKKISYLLVLVLLMVFYCVLTMGCRAAFLSCFVIIFCSFISRKNFKTRSLFSFVLILMVFYFFIPFVLQFLPETVSQRFSFDMLFGSGDSMAGRSDIWDLTMNYITENIGNLVFGNGAGSTQHLFIMATHNFILQIIIELGFVGVILFLGFVISFMFFLWRNNHRLSFSLFVGTIFMSMSLSVNGILAFWINIAMTFVFLSIENNNLNYNNRHLIAN